jgi:hypothetical protein
MARAERALGAHGRRQPPVCVQGAILLSPSDTPSGQPSDRNSVDADHGRGRCAATTAAGVWTSAALRWSWRRPRAGLASVAAADGPRTPSGRCLTRGGLPPRLPVLPSERSTRGTPCGQTGGHQKRRGSGRGCDIGKNQVGGRLVARVGAARWWRGGQLRTFTNGQAWTARRPVTDPPLQHRPKKVVYTYFESS